MAKKTYDDDDGRTIVNMNVEGMPWYRPENPDGPANPPEQLTKEESRAAMWGALKAALLVAGIFALGFFLFILFCDKVWFKSKKPGGSDGAAGLWCVLLLRRGTALFGEVGENVKQEEVDAC